MKKTLALFLLIFNTLSAWAATTFKSGDLYYKIVSDSEPYAVEVTYQTLVPNNNYSGLTEVEIPTTVKYNKTTYEVIGISWYAFHECADLRSVLIPNSIQTIHFQAFEGCSSLNSIIIPNSVTHIYGDAFTGSGIYNDPSNWHNHALYIGDWLICTNPDSISGIYNIKPGTRCIADEAFIYCEALKSVNIPNSVEIIGMLSFGVCDSLETLVIPSSVKHIEIGAAESCPSLNRIVVESGNTHYDSRENCNAIIETATNTLLSGCNTTVVPQSITHIADYAFDGCQFSSFSIPKNIKYIGDWAFANCSNLKVFTCEATELPELGTDIFSVIGDIPPLDYATPINEATLFVPQEALEKYKTADQWYKFGTILPIGTYSPDLFPTLWGLQRTTCLKNINENEVGTVWGSNSYLMQEIETTTIDGKQYLLFGTNNTYDEYWSLWLREENNKILVYSAAQKKDLVLYDFTLNVGDSLPRLYVDEELSSIVDYYKYEADWEYTKPLFVTEVSTITLLDGKEYKKWTFDNGMEYVEGIGSFGTSYAWNDFYQLIANGPLYSDVFSQHLVCASKNGQLLYKMDEAEMEQLETECLCEIEPKWSETWCDTWNVIREYDGSGSDDVRTHCYQLAQDTVVEGKTYSVLTRYWTADPNSPKEYVGMVRFTDDRKVYANYNGKEYLVYDFSVQAGDTLEVLIGVEDYDHTQTCLVHDVSIDEESNRTVITLYVYDEYSEEFIKDDLFAIKWIEGIGSDNGFYEGIELFSLGIAVPHLLCAYKDGNQVYATNKDFLLKYGCEYNTTTDVEDVTTPTSPFSKTLHNGHLLILRDGKTYNVMGMEVTK